MRMVGMILGAALGLAAAAHARPPPPLSATLIDYLPMPATGDTRVTDARSEVARVNFMVEEPGGRRFFVTDQSGPLYVVDKAARRLTPYLDFNGAGERRGMFRRFVADGGYATGLLGLAFDPDYARTGVFYTLHMEDAASPHAPGPSPGIVAGLDASAYGPTPAIPTPSGSGPILREAVLVEWTDRNTQNATFEGAAREVLRVQLLTGIHPINDLAFNPAARRGDPDWRVLYLGSGDGGAGETEDVRRLNPQRLDTLAGKILRIVPDPREHARTSHLSANGQYRIPNDNPFVATPGARGEIWASGLRNPHRLAWDVAKGRATLVAFVIGSNLGEPRYETIDLVRRGANYGFPLREGPALKPLSPVYGFTPTDGLAPVRISETVVVDRRIRLTDSALAYRTGSEGQAIAGGFVYRGTKWPALRGAVVFADITTGRLFYARMADLAAATDGDPATLAPYTEIKTDLASHVGETLRARTGATAFPSRVDLRLAVDSEGEIYVLTKSDGMIRRIETLT